MTMPGFAAEASMYKSATTYATGRSRIAVINGNGVTPQQLPALGGYRVYPVKPAWLCRIEYLLCQGFIPTCTSRCIAEDIGQCALASDPQACEAMVRARCSASCNVACDRQYARCLAG